MPRDTRRKNKFTHAQNVKAIAEINGNKIMPEVYLPKPKKPRVAPLKRRKLHNNMLEKVIEKQMIWHLNSHAHIIAWKSGEESTYNSKQCLHGMADIQGFNLKTKEVFFVEVKAKGGTQRHTQVAFMGVCIQMGLKYVLAYEMKDLEEIL